MTSFQGERSCPIWTLRFLLPPTSHIMAACVIGLPTSSPIIVLPSVQSYSRYLFPLQADFERVTSTEAAAEMEIIQSKSRRRMAEIETMKVTDGRQERPDGNE